jgi:peptide methionine sulfoxide reductase MsrB
VNLTDEEWKKILPEDVYYIARMKGTERPWSSKYETSEEIGHILLRLFVATPIYERYEI